jgi:hypothetical protein
VSQVRRPWALGNILITLDLIVLDGRDFSPETIELIDECRAAQV